MNGFFEVVLSQLEAGLESLKTEPNLIHRLDASIKLVKKAISGCMSSKESGLRLS